MAVSSGNSSSPAPDRQGDNHHIFTDKNKKWTPRFAELFEKAGMKLSDPENIIPDWVAHKGIGRHPEALHEWAWQEARTALEGVAPYTEEFAQTLEVSAEEPWPAVAGAFRVLEASAVGVRAPNKT